VLTLYVILIGLLAFFHFIDFILVRFLDMSIWFALDFVFEECVVNFLQLLYASNISLLIWGAVGIGIFLLLIFSLSIYRLTEKLSKKRFIPLSTPMQLLSIGTVASALFIWDYSFHSLLSAPQAQSFKQALPLKNTFYPQLQSKLYLSTPLSLRQEPLMVTQELTPKIRPNIFLFIVESIREDFITPKVTPHLHAFKKQNLSCDTTLASANATHCSWFSIFHSQFPFYWKEESQKDNKLGSFPLRLIKQWGYQIHVVSASHLEYYRMDEILFGKDRILADSFDFFPHVHATKPHQSDKAAIEHLENSLASLSDKVPHLFVIFLDSSHFDYSWPEEFSLFEPAAKRINYLKTSWNHSEIEGVKNRYRNALCHIDHLFGKFEKALKRHSQKDNSIVIFTADHGEEFHEKGYLFHGSHLSKEQSVIPLYLHVGTSIETPNTAPPKIGSHIDIFPTLFHLLLGKECHDPSMQGQSFFKKDRTPYAFTARYNAGRTPFEFFIHNGQKKLTLQFSNRSHPATCQELNVISISNPDDQLETITSTKIKQDFSSAFQRL
jgi:hypothetical protein